MKNLPSATLSRINEINALLPLIDDLGASVYTYAGGTYPYLIDLYPIEVNGLKVIIQSKKAGHNDYVLKETYKANKVDAFALNGLTALKYDLSVILKAFKQALK